jgi:hypothetical protein
MISSASCDVLVNIWGNFVYFYNPARCSINFYRHFGRIFITGVIEIKAVQQLIIFLS